MTAGMLGAAALSMEAGPVPVPAISSLNPAIVEQVSAPCPACDATSVYERDSAGESVRVPALQIVTELGCTCQACRYAPTPEYYPHPGGRARHRCTGWGPRVVGVRLRVQHAPRITADPVASRENGRHHDPPDDRYPMPNVDHVIRPRCPDCDLPWNDCHCPPDNEDHDWNY